MTVDLRARSIGSPDIRRPYATELMNDGVPINIGAEHACFCELALVG
ncbi:hypothetical protein [Streptomyces griseorubiginosus]